MWQPLRRRGLGITQMMIVTIGLSLAMQYAFQYFIGAGTVPHRDLQLRHRPARPDPGHRPCRSSPWASPSS